jgi:hypothetical protein
MKFLPSTTDDSFGWEDLLLLISAVAVPGVIFLVWIVFFRKQPRRRKRRRRRISTQAAYARSVDLPSVSRTEKAPGEPKS